MQFHFIDTTAVSVKHRRSKTNTSSLDEAIDNATYAVIFAVNTPAVEHSGLSHLAEHMCFRGSLPYPADHELFVANSLLPLSINATTHANATFFYVTTDNEALLSTAVDYLYHGLRCHYYTYSQFETERSGVIFNELQLLERCQRYSKQAAIRIGDTGEQAYRHAGGFTHTINTITFEALIAYKQKWYTDSNIDVFIASPERATFKHCQTIILQHCQSDKYINTPIYPFEKRHHPPLTESTPVFTWWIPACYIADLQCCLLALNDVVHDNAEIIIDDEINHLGQFALRLIPHDPIHCSLDALKQTVVDHLLSVERTIQAKALKFVDSKLPSVVQDAICQYTNRKDQKLGHPSPLKTYLLEPHISTCARFESANAIYFKPHIYCHPSVFAKKHADLLSVSHFPPLPRLLRPIADMSNSVDKFVANDGHWVYEITHVCTNTLIKLLRSAAFWQPRTQGECYAMGVGTHNSKRYVYGAQDVSSYAREIWLDRLFKT
ncbi:MULTISPECIES: insulinase family protein [unclassified Alteromonas]|jgi:hypothetical protein|uniref:insulinase family protein n=1 Tax=unclassified Alteromonas TaxID=2614992 RepID=UPI0005094F38|nr:MULTISPECIES: insulinase family protein [unclassified Alteromonas]MAI38739.1 insulinase family protein [Alteromonas sp.]OUX85265.1 MAG: insulinase family protein [Alteromonas sp. TMED35]|tara:strand:+ start:31219 stop:32697 length:1479 start_codon:yes stop_codon:yes gene_type:complete